MKKPEQLSNWEKEGTVPTSTVPTGERSRSTVPTEWGTGRSGITNRLDDVESVNEMDGGCFNTSFDNDTDMDTEIASSRFGDIRSFTDDLRSVISKQVVLIRYGFRAPTHRFMRTKHFVKLCQFLSTSLVNSGRCSNAMLDFVALYYKTFLHFVRSFCTYCRILTCCCVSLCENSGSISGLCGGLMSIRKFACPEIQLDKCDEGFVSLLSPLEIQIIP